MISRMPDPYPGGFPITEPVRHATRLVDRHFVSAASAARSPLKITPVAMHPLVGDAEIVD